MEYITKTLSSSSAQNVDIYVSANPNYLFDGLTYNTGWSEQPIKTLSARASIVVDTQGFNSSIPLYHDPTQTSSQGWVIMSDLGNSRYGCDRQTVDKIRIPISANNGSADRSFTVNVTANTQYADTWWLKMATSETQVTVIQPKPSSGWMLSVSPAEVTIPASGGNTTINVTSYHAVQTSVVAYWTSRYKLEPATPWANWSPMNGSGSGTTSTSRTKSVNVSVEANQNSSQRTFTIVFQNTGSTSTSGQTKVIQEGYTPPSSWGCQLRFNFGSVNIPQTGTWDDYNVYYCDAASGDEPTVDGDVMCFFQVASYLYNGSWNPAQAGELQAYPPFEEDDPDNFYIGVPEMFKNKNLILEAEFGSGQLGIAIHSYLVNVYIPDSGGTINVTIPSF